MLNLAILSNQYFTPTVPWFLVAKVHTWLLGLLAGFSISFALAMSGFTRLILSLALDTLLLSVKVIAVAFAPTSTIIHPSGLDDQATFEPTTRLEPRSHALELRQNSQIASLATCGWVAGNPGWWKPLREPMIASIADQVNSQPSDVWPITLLRHDQYFHRLLRTLIVCGHLHDLL
jgi:hypothetical protein